MGAFDSVNTHEVFGVCGELQTKDFDCLFDTYYIDSDGSLTLEGSYVRVTPLDFTLDLWGSDENHEVYQISANWDSEGKLTFSDKHYP